MAADYLTRREANALSALIGTCGRVRGHMDAKRIAKAAGLSEEFGASLYASMDAVRHGSRGLRHRKAYVRRYMATAMGELVGATEAVAHNALCYVRDELGDDCPEPADRPRRDGRRRNAEGVWM
jgi:hypothetical protein